MTSVQTLTEEVLRVLVTGDARWDRCCGPNGKGMAAADILAALNQEFPASGWDQQLLDDIVFLSVRGGRMKQLPLDKWYYNSAMIQVNPANSVYRHVSPATICAPQSCKITSSNLFVAS